MPPSRNKTTEMDLDNENSLFPNLQKLPATSPDSDTSSSPTLTPEVSDGTPSSPLNIKEKEADVLTSVTLASHHDDLEIASASSVAPVALMASIPYQGRRQPLPAAPVHSPNLFNPERESVSCSNKQGSTLTTSFMGRDELMAMSSSDIARPVSNDTALPTTNPGSSRHREWIPISIHTAKCDICSEHNTTVIQRCTRCNKQFCFTCIDRASEDNIHEANKLKLDWKPKRMPRSRGKKNTPSKNTRNTVNDDSDDEPYIPTPRSANSVKSRRVTKATPRKPAREETPQKLVPTLKRAQPSLDEDGMFFGQPERLNKRRVIIDPEYIYKGSTTDEDDGQEYSERQGMTSTPQSHYDRYEKWNKVEEDLRKPFAYSNGKGKEPSRPAHLPFRAPSSASDSKFPFSSNPSPKAEDCEDFDSIIAMLNARNAEKELKEREATFSIEQRQAWDNNVIIQAMLEEGKFSEARELFDAASTMLASKRGLMNRKRK